MKRDDLPSFADVDFLERCTERVLLDAIFERDFAHLKPLLKQREQPRKIKPRQPSGISGQSFDTIIMDDPVTVRVRSNNE